MVYPDLILNLTLLVALSVVSGFIEERWPRNTRMGILLQGVLFGGTAVIGMLRPLNLGAGLIFDGRSVMLSLCALFYGPWAMAAAASMALVCRLGLGGTGTLMGVLTILASSGIGLVGHYRLKPEIEPPSTRSLYLLGLAVHLAMIALMFTLPADTALATVKRVGVPVILLYPLATILAGKILSDRILVFHEQAQERAAQLALRESEERFRTFFDNAPFGKSITGLDGRLMRVNAAFCSMLGYTPEEMLNLSFAAITHPDDLVKSRECVRSLLAGEHDVWEMNKRYMALDGRSVWAHVTTRLQRNAEGKPLHFITHILNITEQKRAEEILRESEEKHRALVDGLPDIIMRFDRNGRHLFVSGNVEQAVAIPVADFIGRTHRELGFPEAQCRFWEEAIRRVFDTGEVHETEFGFEGRRGTAIYNLRLLPESGAEGAVNSVLSISRDITAHRRVEQDYRMLFREMLEGFAVHEILCDEQGHPADYRFLAVNPAFERMTGLKAEDLVGRTVLDVLPGIEPYWIETYGKVALTGEPLFFDQYAAELDKHFEVTAFRPAPNQFACIFSDVTEYKRAEEALKVSLTKYRVLFESFPMGITITDKTGNLIESNRAAERLLGLQTTDLQTRQVDSEEWRIIRTDGSPMPPEEYASVRALKENRLVENTEMGIVKPTGDVTWINVTAAPIPLEDYGLAIAYGDITARRLAEDEHKKLEAQLHQAQKLESVGRLAGGVAHDFNNMLGIILGHTEMAMDQLGPDQPLFADLQEIRKAGERSAELTRQLLAFARKQTVTPKVLDLNDTVSGMLKMLRRLIGEDIDLAWMPGASLWPVKIDPSQIDQMMANLCVNARDAITGVGRVTIETHNAAFDKAYCTDHAGFVPGEYICLAVSDDGCGMDKETLDKIFEPFFTTKAVGKGTGLGLSMIYGIVKQNNGFINVYSEPGEGTSFRIYLPRFGGEPLYPEARGAMETPLGHGETVLLVEDEPAILHMSKRMLERLGYQVLTADSPTKALRLAHEHAGRIDLFMTDVVMPEMNGRDLAEQITAIRPGLGCLFMSGYTANAIAHHGVLDVGVNFIQKPFSWNDLAVKVRNAMDPS